LGKVLHPCSTNEPNLSFDDEGKAHHHNKGSKCHEEVNLQTGNNCHKGDKDSD
jgi:hypothetical protein